MAAARRFGDLLLELGFIDEVQLKEALDEQRRTGQRLGRILIQSGAITEARLVRALSRQLGIEVCTPLTANIHARVKALVPAEMATRFHVLPIALTRDGATQTLFVATADPLDMIALEALRRQAGPQVRVRWLLAGETEVELALARLYGVERPSVGGTPLPHLPTDVDAVLDAAASPLEIENTPRLVPGSPSAPLWQARSTGGAVEDWEPPPISTMSPAFDGGRAAGSGPQSRAGANGPRPAQLAELDEPPPRAAPIRLEASPAPPPRAPPPLGSAPGPAASLRRPGLPAAIPTPTPIARPRTQSPTGFVGVGSWGDLVDATTGPLEPEREPASVLPEPAEVFGEELDDAPVDLDDFDLPIDESTAIASETPSPLSWGGRDPEDATPPIVLAPSGPEPPASKDPSAEAGPEAPWAAALAQAAARALDEESLHALADEAGGSDLWMSDTLNVQPLDPGSDDGARTAPPDAAALTRRPGTADDRAPGGDDAVTFDFSSRQAEDDVEDLPDASDALEDSADAASGPGVAAVEPGLDADRIAGALGTIEALIAGEPLDTDALQGAVRLIAAVLVEAGLFDDARLVKALERLNRT